MTRLKLYRCSFCDNIFLPVQDSGVNPVCCGSDMEMICAKSKDIGQEKHTPVMVIDGCKVDIQVGENLHPSTEGHHIQWIALLTDKGFYLRHIDSGMEPTCCFRICDDEKIHAAYAYCNLHGLWKSENCDG